MIQWFIRFTEFAAITEFNEISAPFRKSSITPYTFDIHTWLQVYCENKNDKSLRLQQYKRAAHRE